MEMSKVLKLDNSNPDFYVIMGKYLSRRDIVKEIGGNVWDDDGKVWFIALNGDEVQGWVAVTVNKSVATYCSDYVLQAHRGSDIEGILFDARDKEYNHLEVRATVSTTALKPYLSRGFCEIRTNGQYTVIERKAVKQ